MTGRRLSEGAFDGHLFSPFRRDSRKLSQHLSDQVSEIQFLLDRGPLNFDLADQQIVEGLMTVLNQEPPTVQSATKFHQAIKHYGQTVYRYILVLKLEGSKELVDYWPDEVPAVQELVEEIPVRESGFDLEAPHWSRNGNDDLEFRLEHKAGETLDVAGTFAFQEKRVRKLVAAVADQTDQFVSTFRNDLKDLVRAERLNFEAARRLYDTIHLPEYVPPLMRVKESDAHEEPDVDEDAGTLPPRLTITDDDWKTFLWVVQRWASVVEHNPKSFCSLDEYALRDLLLATLRAVYPVALGEVMNAGKKSDIFVIPDPSRPDLVPIITELKVGSSQKLVREAVAQHLGQLSVRETKGTLIFFITAVRRRRAFKSIKEGIETSVGFQRWADDDLAGDWVQAKFRSPDDPHKLVHLYVGGIQILAPSKVQRSPK